MKQPFFSKLFSLRTRWRAGEIAGSVRASQRLSRAVKAVPFAWLTFALLLWYPLTSAWGSSELEKLLPPSASPGARYGGALLFADGQLVVGAPGASQEDDGLVYVYEGDSEALRLQQVVRPVVGTGDSFGSTLARSGDSLFVGSPSEARVYVFRRSSSNSWSLRQVIRGSGGAFGQSLAVSGNTLAVGAPERALVQGSTRAAQAGAVYLYEKEGTLWKERELLVAPQAQAQDSFGSAVALRDGWLLVGARGVDRLPAREQGFALDAGAVFSFRRHSSGDWKFYSPYRIDAPVSYTRAGFGQAILMSEDRVVITAPQDSAGSLLAGSVYLFRPSSFRPGQLIFEQRLDAPPGAGPNDRIGTSFGSSIALSPNQEFLAVGSVGVPVDFANPDAGEVRVFRADGQGPFFAQSQVMRASDAEALDFGGGAVALSNGGDLWMGALGDDDRGQDAGAVYRFAVGESSLPAPTLALLGLLCLGGGLTLAGRRASRSI